MTRQVMHAVGSKAYYFGLASFGSTYFPGQFTLERWMAQDAGIQAPPPGSTSAEGNQ